MVAYHRIYDHLTYGLD